MKTYRNGFTVMRLQHVHIGHQYLIDKALEMSDRFLILIGAEKELTERNPLSFELRVELLNEIYGHNEHLIFAPLYENFTSSKEEWGDYVYHEASKQLNSTPDFMIYGAKDKVEDDRSKWFSNRIKASMKLIDETDPYSITATELRSLLSKDDYINWSNHVDPKIRAYFNTLRECILNVKKAKCSVR